MDLPPPPEINKPELSDVSREKPSPFQQALPLVIIAAVRKQPQKRMDGLSDRVSHSPHQRPIFPHYVNYRFSAMSGSCIRPLIYSLFISLK